MSRSIYFPRGEWQTTDAAGFDPARLAEAVAFAESHESTWPRDLDRAGATPGMTEIEKPPWNEILGPLKPRGGPSGLIIRGGRIAAQWGDLERVDMTFSIAKSYLAILTGIALGDGLIGDVDDLVSRSVPGSLFEGEHNGAITWRSPANANE